MTGARQGDYSRCKHGTRTTYGYGCRCTDCTEAQRVGCAAYRAARRPLAADDPRHGTANGYTNYGCRCLDCCQAYSPINAAYRARRKADA